MANPLNIIIPADATGTPAILIRQPDFNATISAETGLATLEVSGFGVDENGVAYYTTYGPIRSQLAQLVVDEQGNMGLVYGGG